MEVVPKFAYSLITSSYRKLDTPTNTDTGTGGVVLIYSRHPLTLGRICPYSLVLECGRRLERYSQSVETWARPRLCKFGRACHLTFIH